DQRRGGARWQRADDGLSNRGDLRYAGIDGSALAEEHFDDANAIVGVRLDVLDIVDRGGERALLVVVNALFDFLGVQTGISPDDAHHRDVDRGENVGRRA